MSRRRSTCWVDMETAKILPDFECLVNGQVREILVLENYESSVKISFWCRTLGLRTDDFPLSNKECKLILSIVAETAKLDTANFTSNDWRQL